MSDVLEIDFGRVSKYFDDKGFGFVGQSIQNKIGSDIFFHIKTIKKSDPGIAKNLDDGGYVEDSECENNKNSPDAICFWYRVEKTNKGPQVKSLIHIIDLSDGEVNRLRRKIEKIWQDNKSISNCLIHATEDLLGADRTNELRNKNKDPEVIEKEKCLKYLKNQKKEMALRLENGISLSIEESLYFNKKMSQLSSTIQKITDSDGAESKHLVLLENEYKQIIEEMKYLEFTHSRELSNYIVENKLGEKYRNISGIVKMEQDGNTWDFHGGFPKYIYKRICEDLGLDNEHSRAKAVDFESYKDLRNK